MNKTKLFNAFMVLTMVVMAVGMPVTASAQGDSIQCPEGMVGYWKFDDDGRTVACVPMVDYDGTIFGAAFSAGIVGNALQFDGVDDYVAFSTHEFVNTSDSFSYSVWIKFNEDVNGTCSGPTYEYDQMMVSIHDGPYLYLGTSGRMVAMTIQPDNSWLILKTNRCSWVKDTWYYMVVTLDSNNMKIYVDGSLENQIPGGLKKPSGDSAHLKLGKMHYLDDYYFNGSMDELAIFNRALSVDEIQQYYQSGLGGQPYFEQPSYNPSLSARLTENQVHGYEWPLDADVTLFINGNEIETKTVTEADWDPNQTFVWFDLNESSLTLQAGQFIEMTDGTVTKTHTVTSLVVDGVDPVADTVYGRAGAGSQVDIGHIFCNEFGCFGYRREIADGSGNWVANFSVPGEDNDEQDIIDITPGMGNEARQCDEDGDCTQYGWNVLQPVIWAHPNDSGEDWIDARDWKFGETIQLTIDNDTDPFNGTLYTDSGVVGPANWNPSVGVKEFHLGNFDLETGHIVTLTSPTATKVLVITNINVTELDLELGTISGTAEPGSAVQAWQHEEPHCNADLVTDEYGFWVVDFSQCSLSPGVGGGVGQKDVDEDSTVYFWRFPNPTFQAQPQHDRVAGWEWPLGETVTVTINDPGTPENIDISGDATVEVANWDPNQTWFEIDFQGLYDLKSGDLVTVSHGTTVKTLTVAPLNISDVDPDADTVTGTTDPFAELNVWIHEENSPNLNVTADFEGNWTADFAGLWDIGLNTNGAAGQYDEDWDETWVGWEITRPRIEVSYEHDWIQIFGFTPGGEVTYTIFDEEGGHALFGPVTGPVDSHGEGWISQNLTHTDLIPGYYITAVNETTSEEVSILIRNLNFDYLGVDDDRAYGTAEPNSTIDFHVSETYNQGFNLTVDVDETGYWEVDLATAGHPIDSYRHAGINLYDAEGDNIHAQAPRIVAQVGTDNIGIDFYTKNNDITLTVYDSPGGSVLYGPEVLRTNSAGNAWVSLWEYGIDLVPGYYIVAHDHYLDFTKSLEIEPFTFDEINAAEDTVQGTSLPGERVELHVESLFSNWGRDALTDPAGIWFRDYGLDNYDITDQMWAYGWAIDDQNNWSEDHITGQPNIEASVVDDWISGYNFSPDRNARIRIFADEGGALLADFQTYIHGDTQFNANSSEHGIDLQAGMYLLVEDLETGKTAALTLVHLTFDGVDYDADTAWGQADEGAQVVVRANHLFESYTITVLANETGYWFADFAVLGADITPEWHLRALVFDLENDSTVADAPQLPSFTASLDRNWIDGNNWTPNSTVTIDIYEYKGGLHLGGPVTWYTDNYGHFNVDLWNQGYDLQPDFYVSIFDPVSGVTKSLTLANLSIDYVDADNDVAGGIAPPDTRLSVDFNNDQQSIQFDLFSESDGTWEADFGAHDFDLQPNSEGNVRIQDEDGDATQVEVWVANPQIGVRANDDSIEGWEWPLGNTVTIKIGNPENPDYTGYATVEVADWDPNQTTFYLGFRDEYDLKPGDLVTASDGTSTKEHVVTELQITEFDLEADIVSGFATPNGVINVWACDNNNCYNVDGVPVDAAGEWNANFQNVYDIQAGTWVDSGEWDEDGDSTMFGVNIPNPVISVRLDGNTVTGYEWPLNTDISLTINGVELGTGQMAEAPWGGETIVFFELNGLYTVKPGDIVTLQGGGFSNSHTVFYGLSFDSADVDADTITGSASVGASIQVNQCDNNNCADRYIEGTEVNPWTVDFSVEGPRDDEKVLRDLVPGMGGEIWQFDEFGNSTVRGWYIPNPTFGVRVNYDGIEGWEWPLGATVTIEIAGFTPSEPITATVGVAEWDPNQTYFSLNIENYDLKTGDIVTVTDGNTTKELTITHFEITGYDLDTDMVYGEAGENQYVNVWTCWQDDPCIGRDETANENGEWSTNFSVPGEQDWEEETADLRPGSWIDSSVSDEDGDQVLFGINVPFNQPPTNIVIFAPADPVQVGIPVAVSATFEDPDDGDTHTATWDWGDGTTSTGTVTGNSVYDEHLYGQPGVYVLTLTVTDRVGAEATATYQYIVAYDPNGGFVTGGGWFDTTDGKANFGFNAKYHPDAKVPYGNTQFQVGQMKFKADSYNWLVVSEARAQYQGVGTINNTGDYGFFITLIDGQLSGGEDLFRIKIWDLATGDVVYDTQPGDPNYADPVTAIEGGSIVVHKAK